MGIEFGRVGKGKIFSLDQARRLKQAAEVKLDTSEFPMCGSVGKRMSEHKTPWHVVPGFEGRSAIFDADNEWVTVVRSDIAQRIVEAMNETEGKIAHG